MTTNNYFLGKYSRNLKSGSTSMKFNYKSWCKLFNVLSVRWYIKFYDVFFVFFCFTAAKPNATICMMPVAFHEQGDCNELIFLAMWQDSRWWRSTIERIFAQSFLFQIFQFCICAKNQKIIEWIKLIQSLKEGSSWKLICHWKSRENTTDFQLWS